MTQLPRLRDRRRLLRHRRGQGAAPARHRRSTASRSPTASAATGSSATRTGCRRRTARCTSTRRASGWSTRTSRCRSRIPTSRTTRRSREYFDDYVDHFGFRDRIRSRPASSSAQRGADGVWDADARRRRQRRSLRRAARRQRPPLGPALARAGVPRHDSTACRCTRTTTPTRPSVFRGKRVRRRRHGQQRDGHRRRGELVGAQGVPVGAARRVRHAQVPVRPAARPVSRQLADAHAAVRAFRQAILRRCYRVARRRHGALRAARSPTTGSARRTRRSPPTPRPHRPRRDHAEAEHRRARRRPRALRPTAVGVRPTSIVYCTGYKVTFPFFDEDFISAPDNDLPLFLRVFHPGDRQLVLHRAAAAARRDHAARRGAGPLGRATTCAASTRCPRRPRWQADMRRRARGDVRAATSPSKRHTMQVDFDDYLYDARQGAEARRPRARARSGFALPVAARARRSAQAAPRRDRRRRRASASRPRPRTARRSSRPRVRSSPSWATTRPACATSSGAPTSPPARSTTTSPTRRRCSARSSTRAREEVRRRVRAARAGAAALESSSSDAYRA